MLINKDKVDSRKMNNTLNNSTMEIKQRSLVQYLMVWTVCLVALIAFAEHFAILLLTYVSKTLQRKPYIVSILLLSSSDILLSTAMFLFSLISLIPLQQTWICGFAFFLMQLGFITSLVHTFIICTERYLCSRPIPTEPFSLRKRHILTLINIGICSLILGIPYIFTVRKPTIYSCKIINIFGDNVSYALLPVRTITFLIWICTIVIYTMTAKSFRNVARRTGHFVRSHYTQNNAFPKVVKFTTNNQNYPDVSLPSGLNTGLSNIKEGQDSTTGKNKQNEISNYKVRDAVPKNSENIQVTKAGPSNDALHAIFPESNINHSAQVNTVIKVQDAKHENNTTEDTDLKHEKENPPIRRNIFRPLLHTSTTTFSCSSSDTAMSHKQSNLHSSAREETFRVVSVIFVVFLITMTPQSLVGLVRIVFPMSEVVVFGCSILAVSSVITNPFMYAFLLKDFRKAIRRCKLFQ